MNWWVLVMGLLCMVPLQASSSEAVMLTRGRRFNRITIINHNNHQIEQHSTNTVATMPAVGIQKPSKEGFDRSWKTVNAFIDYVTRHRWVTVLGILGALYSSTYAVLLHAQATVQHGWSAWYEKKLHEQPTGIDQAVMAEQLFSAIKARYLSAHYGPLNILDPIVGFIHDCDKEIKQLEQLGRVVRTMSWLRADCLFCFVELNEQRIQKKVESLWYLKQLLIASLGNYSVAG